MLELILDQDGRCLDATDELLELLGYRRAELSQLPLEQFLAVPAEPVHTFLQARAGLRQSAEALPVNLRRKDGVLVPGELRGADTGLSRGSWVVRAASAGDEDRTSATPLPVILAEWRELTRLMSVLDEADPQLPALARRIDDVRRRYQAASRQVADGALEPEAAGS